MQELLFVCRTKTSGAFGGIAMTGSGIYFRGTKAGVIVAVNGHSSYQDVREAFEEKFSKSSGFFKSGNIYMDFSNASIDKAHQDEIKRMIFDNYKITVKNFESGKPKIFNGINEGRTKFIHNTVRSGQSIECQGNIVIIGDVNAGGQIAAAGNIIVMGALRGMVHAGTTGNHNAIIAAFSLQPTQLRIADMISRAPDGENSKPKCPELARIKDGNIVIEPYAPNKELLQR